MTFSFLKGLYQKAEALYTMGDLEFALVFYHRGRKLRPELEEFRLGIQKAQEAIENSVGSKSQNYVKYQFIGALVLIIWWEETFVYLLLLSRFDLLVENVYCTCILCLTLPYVLSYPEKLENKEDLSSFCKGEVRFYPKLEYWSKQR